MSIQRCPKCNAQARYNSDMTIRCLRCGYNANTRKPTLFKCPYCHRGIHYIKNDGMGKCKTHGVVKPERRQ